MQSKIREDEQLREKERQEEMYKQTKERQEVQSEFYEAVFNAYKRHQEQKENSRKAISF